MKKQFKNFQEARKFVHSLKFKSGNEWRKYCNSGNRPLDIPSNPNQVYRQNGWKGMGDWLGTGRIANYNKKFRPFNDTKKYVQKLKLKNHKEWQKHCNSGNKPEDIPTKCQDIYKKGWKDFLGTKKEFLEFTKARTIVQQLGLTNMREWVEFKTSRKIPKNIPKTPVKVYKKEWIGWGDWLGTGNIAMSDISKNYLSFHEARKEARLLAKKYGIKTQKDWTKAKQDGKIPDHIPASPWSIYSKEKRDGNEN